VKVLETAIYDLLKVEPFFATFVLNSRLNYVNDDKICPTAYATVINGSTVLGFNTKFIEEQSPQKRKGVLKHEILHLLFDHVNPNLYNRKNKAEAHNWNIAMDCAINQFINSEELPEGAVTLDSLSKALKTQLEPFQTSAYYYDKIQQAPDSCKSKVEGMSTLDDHDMLGSDGKGGEMSAEDAQIAKGIVHKKAQEAMRAAKGIVPEGLTGIIDALNDIPQVNWKQLLRNFVATATSNKTLATRKKANRRFGLDQPGKKKKRELTLGVCIDTSGSISDDSFKSFITEIQEISKYITAAHLIYADCVVHKVVKVDSKNKIPMERYGAGGTAYQPAISKALELKCDAILYLGDFDSSDTPENPCKPFLWVGVGQQPPPGDFGKVIRINEKA
jgi:predicted metal-dependent peptidase